MAHLSRSLLWCFLLGVVSVLSTNAAFGQFNSGRNVEFLANRNDYPDSLPVSPLGSKYSSCWSYVHGDGREYAVIGTFRHGTLIYNVTNPSGPILVGTIPGPRETHREMKSYRNWIYVVTESDTLPNPGVQIIRMTNPDNPVLVGTYTATFNRAHTVTVDTSRALLICNGTRNASGVARGVRILSLANPESPVEIGSWPGGAGPVPDSLYVHDSDVVGDSLYASCSKPTGRVVRVLDISNPAAPIERAVWSYPGASVTHSTAIDPTRNFLYVCDESAGHPLRVLSLIPVLPLGFTPPVIYEFKPNPQPVLSGQHVIHNPRVKGNELYLSSYTEGIRILDISEPSLPAEFGWADSYPGVAPDWWYSVWEVCPFFPSGIVIASDMQTGLYIYRPIRNYGLLRVDVVDEANGQAISGATVELIPQGDVLTTGANGIVQFGPSPGSHTIQVSRAGYLSEQQTRTVTAGSQQTVLFELGPPPGGGGGGDPGECNRCHVENVAREEKRGQTSMEFRPPWPNPARQVRLVLDIPSERTVVVDVIDLAGRRLTRLHRGTVAAGQLSLAWDGRDDDGQPVRTGVYLALARSGNERAQARFVLVR